MCDTCMVHIQGAASQAGRHDVLPDYVGEHGDLIHGVLPDQPGVPGLRSPYVGREESDWGGIGGENVVMAGLLPGVLGGAIQGAIRGFVPGAGLPVGPQAAAGPGAIPGLMGIGGMLGAAPFGGKRQAINPRTGLARVSRAEVFAKFGRRLTNAEFFHHYGYYPRVRRRRGRGRARGVNRSQNARLARIESALLKGR